MQAFCRQRIAQKERTTFLNKETEGTHFNTAPEMLCMTCKTDQFKKQRLQVEKQVEKKIQTKTPKQTKLNATNCDFKFGTSNLFTSC